MPVVRITKKQAEEARRARDKALSEESELRRFEESLERESRKDIEPSKAGESHRGEDEG